MGNNSTREGEKSLVTRLSTDICSEDSLKMYDRQNIGASRTAKSRPKR